jgi:ribosomal-protein-serine acetyltransferase
LPWVDGTRSEEGVLTFIRENLQAYAEGRGLAAGIWLEQSLVGVIGVHAIDRTNRSATLGYWLSKSSEGRGVMTRSVRALLGYLFEDLSLHRVEIRVAPENSRSRAIPERLGFRGEGHLRDREWLYDHWLDHLVYGLLETDWRSERSDRW